MEKDEAAEAARAELEAKLKALEEAEGVEQNEIDNLEEPVEGKISLSMKNMKQKCIC